MKIERIEIKPLKPKIVEKGRNPPSKSDKAEETKSTSKETCRNCQVS